ncbi:hypothetical protein [Spongiivirga citrea]|uniref:hypothetical protein n=1 Tax=Spongiivirga citrea TaxID=1481457 RepID=UPI001EF9925C|nr:hypothetical protein [Spongiivirga citrea]
MKNLILFTLTLGLLFSCSDDDYGSDPVDPPVDPPVSEANAVRLANNATFGSVMTNSEGFTLYFFAPDTKDESNCNGTCEGAWPAFYAETLTLDNGLNASDFGEITRNDGSKQTTYKGWPMYLFSSDTAAGQINGDGSGGVWFVAKPDYTVMVARSQLVGRDVDGNETNLTSAYEEGEEDTFYITDAEGNTLYSFINDKEDTNTFTADDFSNNGAWPIFEATLESLPSILDNADFGKITVGNREQLTYKGWPLYFFGQDVERGDNYGVGFPQAGAWPVLYIDSDPAPEAVEPTTKKYTITNQGATAYVFNGEGLTDEVNPDLTLKRGETYEFTVNTPGHPFFIKSAQTTGTGDQYNAGVTENGASQATITFTVPNDAPNTLFYICEFHSPMTGTFTIVD